MLLYDRPEDRGDQDSVLAKLNNLPTYAGNLPSQSGQCTVVAVVELSQDLSRRLVSLRSPPEDSLCLT